MREIQSSVTPRFLRTPDAARFLGLSPRTLEKHRTHGTGPQYRKLGGRVVYGVDELQAWADLGLRNSTSDPGHGEVRAAKAMGAGAPSVLTHRHR
jgi:predicted DNA-binding transcriptional regulator AlpA